MVELVTVHPDQEVATSIECFEWRVWEVSWIVVLRLGFGLLFFVDWVPSAELHVPWKEIVKHSNSVDSLVKFDLFHLLLEFIASFLVGDIILQHAAIIGLIDVVCRVSRLFR